MTRDEVKQLLFILSEKYTTFNVDPKRISFKIEAWLEDLEPYSYDEVKKACAAYRDTSASAFAPSTSQIIGLIKQMNRTEMTGAEAWDLVHKAICNGYYCAEEEFTKLPAVVQRAVGSPRLIREYSMMESIDIANNIQPRFLKAYENEVNREKLKGYMPAEARQKLEAKVYKFIPQLETKIEEVYGISEETQRKLDEFLGRTE